MPPELRASLEKEALRYGRSLNSEITARLAASISNETPVTPTAIACEPDSTYQAHSDPERDMLALFRRWTADRQLAFLVLFR